ncbi:MAG: hypothetical protein RLZZ164_237 [Actinomycetota bacterium]
MNLRSDNGNAIVEFVIVGLGLQLAVLAAVQVITGQIDAAAAGQAMLHQGLRAAQLSQTTDAVAITMSDVAKTFGIGSSDFSFTVTGDCASVISLHVKVKGAEQSATGHC